MRSVWIAETGAVLRRHGEAVEVWAQRERKATITLQEVGQVVVMGNVTTTPAVLDLLLGRGIDIVLLSASGRYRGRVVSGVSSNVRLRVRQLRRLDDPAFAIETARILVAGKLANQRTLFRRVARRRRWTEGLRRTDVALRAGRMRLEMCTTLDELRGAEGAGAAAYFAGFGELILADGFQFEARRRRPPTDPANALLSLGYVLLANAVESAVHIVGLDPYLGCLHAPLSGRASLVFDLEEEFRAPFVDALVLALLNGGVFRPDDFEGDADQGITLRRDALRTFVRAQERKMQRLTWYAPQSRRLPWRSVVVEQARAFARHVLEEQRYAPFETR